VAEGDMLDHSQRKRRRKRKRKIESATLVVPCVT
jgi:hypothetical protein